MKFGDLHQIQPLMNKDQVFGIMTWEFDRKYLRENFQVSLGWGMYADRNLDGVDRRNILETISFGVGRSIPLYDKSIYEDPLLKQFCLHGVMIGMPLEEAQPALAHFQAKETHHRKRWRYLQGTLPDSKEITLRFVLMDDGIEYLHEIEIAQPNHSKIVEARKPLGQKAIEAAFKPETWKEIEGDDDRMLMEWAGHCKPWDDYSEDQFVAFAKWLMNSSPIERHAVILRWNWDYGEAPVLWAIRQNDTDLATAVAIYFATQPGFYIKFGGDLNKTSEEHERFLLGMILELKSKIESGFYGSSNIFYDSTKGLRLLKEYCDDLDQGSHTIPLNLKDIYQGIKPETVDLRIPDFGIY